MKHRPKSSRRRQKTKKSRVMLKFEPLESRSMLAAAPITWGAVFGIDEAADIDNSGEHVAAVTFGNVGQSLPGDGLINSIPFTIGVGVGGNAQGTFWTGGGGLTTGDADLDYIFNGHSWTAGTWTLSLTGLVDGTNYQIQLISTGDTRGCCAGRDLTVDDGNGDYTGGPVLRRGNTGAGAPGNDSVIGTFTAIGATQNILLTSNLHPGSSDPGLSGYVLRSQGMSVVNSDPADGDVLGSSPAFATIDFSAPISVASVSSDDLTIDGASSDGFTIVDADTVRFTLPALAAGEHTIQIASGAIDADQGGLTVGDFSATFVIPDVASVVNLAAIGVAATSADLRAEVLDTGGDDPELILFWGDNDGGTSAGNWDNGVPLGIHGVGAVSTGLSGLTQGTQYFYRIRSDNLAGESWAPSTFSFTTGVLSLPSLTVEPAGPIGGFAAGISGEVTDPGGEAPDVTIYFGLTDGGTDKNAWDSSIFVGERLDGFSTTISGLDTETTYFFRGHAENTSGESWSPATRSFTTTTAPDLQITEFMAINNSTLTTRTRETTGNAFGSQETPDWIEIHNLTNLPVDLSGTFLTDRQSDLELWAFPVGTTIAGDGYLVVFASGKDISDPALDESGLLHTNFSLSGSGEFLALSDGSGTIIDQYDYPQQLSDHSYGNFAGEPRFFATPTPGSDNINDFIDLVADTKFSVDRGFYTEPFNLEITTATVGATIRYTLDGTPPSETRGTVYNGAIPINGGILGVQAVRVIAYKAGFESTDVDTQTYLFAADIAGQTAAVTISSGFPTSWGGTSPDYGLDSRIVGPNDQFSGKYSGQNFVDALLAVPTLSIVTDINGVFGSGGIYTNAGNNNLEVPTSFELINPDGSKGFQVNAGLKIQGGAFRSFGLTKKNSFRLKFKTEYGPSTLKFPFFGEDAADEFNTITLRMEANDGWQWTTETNRVFARDEFGRRTQLAMGQPSPHGNRMHLYINGVYWGLYNPVERPDNAFAATYFGGEKEEWDVQNSGKWLDGSNGSAWNTMISLANAVANQPAGSAAQLEAWHKLQGNGPNGEDDPALDDYLDIDNLIDYMIVNLYGGNSDWPHKNFYAGRRRGPDSTGFEFFMWDSEWSLNLRSNVNTDKTNVNNGVAVPYGILKNVPEFQVRFADRLHEHFFNGGALYVDAANPAWDPANPERNIPAAHFVEVIDELYPALIGESARWGDQHGAQQTVDEDWRPQVNGLLNNYFPQRSNIVLNQFKNDNLFTDLDAPEFEIDSSRQHGGGVVSGAQLSFENSNGVGTIWYTTDGSDPRIVGGALNAGSARQFTGQFPLNSTATLKARVLNGGQWSALSEATFTIILSDLRITEVNFNPADPTVDELLVDPTFDNDDFEFIELKNIGATPISLADAQLTDGITFDFNAGDVTSLNPGEYLVVVRNEAAFNARYDSVGNGIQIAGEYSGLLNNGGERLELIDGTGEPLVQFDYDDSWFDHVDGGGFTLTVLDELDVFADLNQKVNWRPSNLIAGSPGEGDTGITPEVVIINEILANSAGLGDGDWIELINTTGRPIDIGNWYLSDSAEQLDKFQFAPGTTIPANGFLVVNQANHFGTDSADPGAIVGFDFSEHGGAAFLSGGDALGNVLGNRESQTFNTSNPGESLGLYTKSTGGTDFIRLVSATPNDENVAPVIGPLVINEIMYNPPVGGVEFLELYNTSESSVVFDDGQGNSWRIRGAIDYSFPAGQSIPADGYVVIIQGTTEGVETAEAAAFRTANDVPAVVTIFVYTESDSGRLSNSGEKIFLDQPGDPDSGLTETPYVLIDAVRYDDDAPWPTAADGGGSSIGRVPSSNYGNDVANWLASRIGGTPGQFNVGVDTTPPTAPTGLVGQVVSDSQTRLVWTQASDPQTGIDFYNVYRNGVFAGSTELTLFTDEVVFDENALQYEVSAVNNDGMEGPRSSVTSITNGTESISFQDGVNGYTGARDTELRQAQSDQNQGTDTNLEVDGNDGNGVDLSVLLKWDIAGVPAGGQVVGAQIVLDVTNQTSGPFQVTRLLKDWDESQATWNQFANGQPWQTAGALGAGDRGVTVGTVNSTGTGKYTIDFNAQGVALVQNWVDGDAGSPNYGFIIANQTSSDGLDFNSREVTTASNRPKLTIVYFIQPELPQAGDVNLDGNVDDVDIDFVYQAIAVGSSDAAFDLNNDSLVSADDVEHLVENILGTKVGDSDLSGSVSRRDVTTLLANFGRTGDALWSKGNFNGDSHVGLADLGRLQPNVGFVAHSAPASLSVEVAARADVDTADDGQFDRLRPLASSSNHRLLSASPRRRLQAVDHVHSDSSSFVSSIKQARTNRLRRSHRSHDIRSDSESLGDQTFGTRRGG